MDNTEQLSDIRGVEHGETSVPVTDRESGEAL